MDLLTSAPPRVRITYFDIRGRVEPIRLIFEELGIEYEDRRIKSLDEWKALKPTMPFGMMPVYEAGDLYVPQSPAILRHLARTHDLCGRTEAEQVQCDIVEEAVTETRELLWRYQWRKDWRETRDAFVAKELSPALSGLERWYRRGGTEPHLWVGDSLTYVDFLAFAFFDELRAFFPETLAKFPDLRRFWERIAGRPQVAAYVSSGRRPAAFGYAIHGLKYDPEVRRS